MRLLAGLVLVLAVPALTSAADRGLETRVFHLKWRGVQEAAQIARPLSSEDARVAMEPKLRVLTITDGRANLERIGQALASFDVPPRSVEVVLTLIRATRPAEARPVAEELRAIKDVVDPVASYSDYEVLGEARLTGVEGAELSTVLGKADAYRVAFRIGVADDRNGVVRFDDLALDRRSVTGRQGEEYRNLLRLTYHAQAGRKVVLGATRASARDTGVLLVMEAVILPEPGGDRTIASGPR